MMKDFTGLSINQLRAIKNGWLNYMVRWEEEAVNGYYKHASKLDHYKKQMVNLDNAIQTKNQGQLTLDI